MTGSPARLRFRSSASSITRTTPPRAPGSTSTARPIRSNCRRRASMRATPLWFPATRASPSTRSAKRWASTSSGNSSPTPASSRNTPGKIWASRFRRSSRKGRGARASDLDLLFSGKKTMSGIPIKSSVNADQTRVDFLDLSHWGRAVMKDIDFFEVGGQTVFPIYGASGGISASFIFYFDTGFQVWNDSRAAAATSMRWRGRAGTRKKR